MHDLNFTLPGLRAAYAAGARPAAIVAEVYRRIAAVADPGIFLHLRPEADVIAEAERLDAPDPERPLWGMPFAVKDNIDVAGLPTTAACPAFAYTPERDAFVVARLVAAGALVIGKTNLDQFATGLNGLRTPGPAPRNAIDAGIVPGGSSSGSAVAVAHGLVPFALGTDTAGSGRVPAALNNLVGLKPTLGALSNGGVLPACRTLDTISVFALTVDDAAVVFDAAAGYDAAEPFSRTLPMAPPALPAPLRIAVPEAAGLAFAGDTMQAASFAAGIALLEGEGAATTRFDIAPYFDVAAMLYNGPWVAERAVVIADLLARDPEAVLPVIRDVVGVAEGQSAADAFRGRYRLAEMKRHVAEKLFAEADVMCVPSIPTFVSVAALRADPIGANSLLGTYTNFVNLLDLCAMAVPLPPREDGRPGSMTLIAPAGADARLAAVARLLERAGTRTLGATGWPRPMAEAAPAAATADEMEIVVCGAHMSGLPLNGELTRLGGRFLRKTATTPDYAFYALPGTPPRPGLVRQADGEGGAIAVEVWALPAAAVGPFLAGIPQPLGLGTVRLADGTAPKGFLCEWVACRDARNVTTLGDWRAVIAAA
ncbi:MAG: allophanate hydrolase [Acuticoccus sp.]